VLSYLSNIDFHIKKQDRKMDKNISQLLFEQLKHIRKTVDRIAADVQDLKTRMTILEYSMTSVKYEVAACSETDARQQSALDRINNRLDRIERRLELQE
jgi:outer membrane murein-binding lipoprotein Lpp